MERLGQYLSLDVYSTQNYDELRPHRGCVESASVLRTCLQGSTLINVTNKTVASVEGEEDVKQSSVRYTKRIPQYHGPSRESITMACKTIELEMNCSETNEEFDDTVALLSGKSALDGVVALVNGSLERTASTSAANLTTTDGAPRNDARTLEVQRVELEWQVTGVRL